MLRFGVNPAGLLRRYTSPASYLPKDLEGYQVCQCRSILQMTQHCNASFGILLGIQPNILLSTQLKKFQSTRAIDSSPHAGVLKRIIKKLGWLEHSRSNLKRSAFYLYESVADQINYKIFFQEFKMEDTFFSWFLITELHVWMLLLRVMAEGEEGRFIRNCIVGAMWEDVSTRAKKLGAANPSSVKTQLQELSEQFQAALIGYDEGLLTDDRVLAGSIWRTFFLQKCNDPQDIECLVKYVRRQVKMLDELPRDRLLLSPVITWLELETNKSDTNG